MMYAFTMDIDTAMELYRRFEQYDAVTEDDRNAILIQMVQEGLITGVTATERTKAEYVADLAKNFKVLDISKEKDNGQETEGC